MRTYSVTMGIELTIDAESVEEAIQLAEDYCQTVGPDLDVIEVRNEGVSEIDGQLTIYDTTPGAS